MNVFDIIGPVIIGPSSSHTAGAARMGRMAAALFKEKPSKVIIKLHGSFAKTCVGHGTDRAIIGGLRGFDIDDERIKTGFEGADFSFSFVEVDFKDAHPNTAEIILENKREKMTVRCASIGGGRIEVLAIDGMEVSFSGEMDTLVIFHNDIKGAIANVTKILADKNINIASMKMFRVEKNRNAIMVIEMDSPVDCTDDIERLDYVSKAMVVKV